MHLCRGATSAFVLGRSCDDPRFSASSGCLTVWKSCFHVSSLVLFKNVFKFSFAMYFSLMLRCCPSARGVCYRL